MFTKILSLSEALVSCLEALSLARDDDEDEDDAEDDGGS